MHVFIIIQYQNNLLDFRSLAFFGEHNAERAHGIDSNCIGLGRP